VRWSQLPWRRVGAAEPGLDPGPIRTGSGLFCFLFFYPILPWWAWNRLEKCHIYRDLSAEAVRKTASVNRFCLPQ
jgi:hypothetical protein